jgi:hypothetical protein
MKWYDILILNISIVDLVLYPVLFALVVVSFITIWKLNKKVKVLQENVSVLQNTKTEQVDHIPSDADFEVAIAIQDQQIPVLGNISAIDEEISRVKKHSGNNLSGESTTHISSVKPPRPEKPPKTVYTPDPATPDISDEDARKHIIDNVTGPVAEAVKKLPENWTLESLKEDKKLKNQLFVLLKAFQHSNDETAKQVTKKLYLLLNPETSKS